MTRRPFNQHFVLMAAAIILVATACQNPLAPVPGSSQAPASSQPQATKGAIAAELEAGCSPVLSGLFQDLAKGAAPKARSTAQSRAYLGASSYVLSLYQGSSASGTPLATQTVPTSISFVANNIGSFTGPTLYVTVSATYTLKADLYAFGPVSGTTPPTSTGETTS